MSPTKPRAGTLAHYQQRVADLSNELAALRVTAQDRAADASTWHTRAIIATERAEQAERERDGESTRADRLSADLAHLTKRHGAQTTALCRAREDLAEESRTVEILRDDLNAAKTAYVRAQVERNEQSWKVTAAQVKAGEAQVEAAALVARYTLARRYCRVVTVAAVALSLTLFAVVVFYV